MAKTKTDYSLPESTNRHAQADFPDLLGDIGEHDIHHPDASCQQCQE